MREMSKRNVINVSLYALHVLFLTPKFGSTGCTWIFSFFKLVNWNFNISNSLRAYKNCLLNVCPILDQYFSIFLNKWLQKDHFLKLILIDLTVYGCCFISRACKTIFSLFVGWGAFVFNGESLFYVKKLFVAINY